MKNIRHIFFDLDNTLWDFPLNSRNVLTDLFHEYNLESRCGITFEEFIQRYEVVNHLLWEKLRKGEISKEQLRSSRFYNSMQHFGYEDYELGYRLELEYVKRSPYQKNLIPGTIELLEKLQPVFNLHIITNGFREVQYIKLENCGIKKFFDQIIISEEAGYSKPNPEIFRLAMKKANATPEESIMIGDDMEVDVLGAMKAGMKAVHFQLNPHSMPENEFAVISVLTDLLHHLPHKNPAS